MRQSLPHRGMALFVFITQSPLNQSPYHTAGTLRYMAPEQLRGQPCLASDQYALAIVVYEWLCGRCPFQGSSALVVAMQHFSHAPQPLHELVPTIPALVEQVVNKGLAKEPKERFASIKDFAEALERAGVSEEITTSSQLTQGIEACSSTQTLTNPSGDSFSTLPASSPDNWLPPIGDRI